METQVKYSLNMMLNERNWSCEEHKYHWNVSDDSINASLICWTMCYFVFIGRLIRLGVV